MATLVQFDATGAWGETRQGEAAVAEALAALGLAYGRWPLQVLPEEASLDEVLSRYREELAALQARLSRQFTLLSVDRVQLHPGTAEWPVLRQKFLAEHTHADAEVRVFLGGQGVFYVRVGDGHVAVLCEAGDWLLVPAGTPHFFDAGEHPELDALRLFSQAEGWLAEPTGVAAPHLPLLDELAQGLGQRLGR